MQRLLNFVRGLPVWVDVLCVVALLWGFSLAYAYAHGKDEGRAEMELQQYHTDSAKTDTAEKVRAEKGKDAVYAKARDDSVTVRVKIIHDTVKVVDSTHLSVSLPDGHDTTVAVPEAVVERFNVDAMALSIKDTRIQTLTSMVVADSAVIRDLHAEVADLKKIKTPDGPGLITRAATDIGYVVEASGLVYVVWHVVAHLLHP